MPPAARILDMVAHPLPPMLTPGPGSVNVFIGGKPAWRGVPAAVAGALTAAKQVSDTAIQAAEAATMAAAGTPGLPAAKAAEEATKAACAASMGSAITAAAGMADIHMCTTPLPLPPHGPGVVIDGSPTVLINNMCACRQGDTILEAVGPPNKIVLGCFTVFIGNGSGGGAATGAPAAPAGSIGMIGNMPVVVQPNGDIKVGDDITITGDNESKIEKLAHLGQDACNGQLKDSTKFTVNTPTGKAGELDAAGDSYSEPSGSLRNDVDPDGDLAVRATRSASGTDEPNKNPARNGISNELAFPRPPARKLLDNEGRQISKKDGLQSRLTGTFQDVAFGDKGDPTTKYLWTIDQRGINLALEKTPFPTPRGNIVHSNLSPMASIAGEAWFTGPNEVTINAGSGRFGYGSGATKSQWDAAVKLWEGLGYKVNAVPFDKR